MPTRDDQGLFDRLLADGRPALALTAVALAGLAGFGRAARRAGRTR